MKAMKVLLLAVLAVVLVAAVGLASDTSPRSTTWTPSFTIADCVTVTFGGDLDFVHPLNVALCTSSGSFKTNEATGNIVANCDFYVSYTITPFTHSVDSACVLPTDVIADFGTGWTSWISIPAGGYSGGFWALVGCPGGTGNDFAPGASLNGKGKLRVLRSGMSDRAGTYTATVAVTVSW